MRFLWGAATSSHQIEGNNENNDWSSWEKLGKIEGGVISGRCTDHWNRYKEDLYLAKELGINSYRFSIEWSRIEPEEGAWDNSAIEWYGQILAECEKYNITPMVTLHHFTSPIWFSEQGDFRSEMASAKFGAYVKKMVKTLGNRIPLWCTLNEPIIMCVGKYLAKFQPPGTFEPQKCSELFSGLLKSHVRAYDLIHSEMPPRRGPWRNQKLLISI
jgi:beta-glucosidase